MSQQQVFDAISAVVQPTPDRCHACLFSYGRTGCG
jgi:hypothetical protein